MDNNNYYEKRNYNCSLRLNEVLKELPTICYDYFIGIESYTSALTRLNYAFDLKLFFNFLKDKIYIYSGVDLRDFGYRELETVTTAHIEAFISYLSYYKNPKTEKIMSNNDRAKARKLSCLKSFFKYFYNHNLLTKDVASKVSMPKIYKKPIIRLDSDEVSTLLESVDDMTMPSTHQQKFYNITRQRDIAILTLFLGTGIRISELVGINVNDVDFDKKEFVVTRKGGNKTTLFFSEEVCLVLHQYYMERMKNKYVDEEETALFLSLQNQRIGVRAVENLVKKYSKQVFPLKNISPHKLRSTFGTNLYRQILDIYAVAEVLGHADINTTKKHYAASSEEIKRNATASIKLRSEFVTDDIVDGDDEE